MTMKIVSTIAIGLLSLSGCSPREANSSTEIRDAFANMQGFTTACQDRLDIPIESVDPMLSSVKTVDYLPSIGVAVTDNVEKRIFVFDTLGKLLRSVGGPGGRQGEFRYIADAVLLRDLTVLAIDDVTGLTSFSPGFGTQNILPIARLSSARWLGHFDSSEILLGQDNGSNSPGPTRSYEVRALNPLTGLLRPLITQSDSSKIEPGAGLFRGLRIATDAQSTRIVIATPLELGFKIHDRNGRLLAHWSGTSPMFNAIRPLARRLEGRAELLRWVMSSSHVTSIAMLDPDTVLVSWESFESELRHYYVAAAVTSAPRLLWTVEVPFRPARSSRGAMVFIDSRREPTYKVVTCGRFSPRAPDIAAVR